MRVIIAGETPFIESVGQLCTESGHTVIMYLVEDFFSAVQSGWAMSEAAVADVVIELHNESAAAKEELLRALGDIIPAKSLLLTSALASSTTQAASWVPNPTRVVGFGLFPPIEIGSTVEVTTGLQTDEVTANHALEFWQSISLKPVLVGDGPGLVRARTVCCIINEAVSALMEGIATPSDIDQAMQLGTNYPFGPLAWADEVGLDTVLGVMTGLFTEWGEDRYRPSPLLKRMVLAGKLGKKSGEGFYSYK